VLTRLFIWIRLGFNEIIYWFVGDMPEFHHANAAYLWERLGRYRKCISHCQKYLAISDDRQMRTMLGYCYGRIGRWEDAIDTYRQVPNWTKEPRIALGLAEAELNVGNIDEARKITVTIAVLNEDQSNDIAGIVNYLTTRISEVNDVTMETSRSALDRLLDPDN
jgi:tetratricopeptide (TPR) repeat protein